MAMEDDDDEFGDLYSDVLRPVAPSNDHQVLISPIGGSTPRNRIPNEEDSPGGIIPSVVMTGNSVPSIRTEAAQIEAHLDLQAEEANFKESQDDRVLDRDLNSRGLDLLTKSSFGGVEEDGSDERAVDTSVTVKEQKSEDANPLSSGVPLKFDVDDEIGDFDEDPVIPGLSVEPLPLETSHGMDSGDVEVSRAEDWDSDSGDDLQIVLNEDHRSSHTVDGVGGDDDLGFVPGEEQLHDHHQSMDSQEWGEEAMQPVVDGEKKEMTDVVKVNTGAGVNMAGRGGFNIHGFHPHHHSQFKYVRPDVASGPGVPAGQIRPFSIGNNAGRGRGVQRGFHPGYGTPIWGNNTPARGLEFTLPSHKTIFDVDIDSFDEKPWRCEGVDITDFFNFEMDEDKWKNYFKQLEQLRLESTMKSKIHVYESGRSEKDYDPDLPPELAAASLQDISPENSHVRKIDGGQIDLLGQGGGTNWMRPQLPTGRAIQVETGTVERFPTIDTRQTRPRDSDDAIIEIVLQGSFDDSEKPGNEDIGDGHVKGYTDSDNIELVDSKSHVRSAQMQDGKCEFVAKKSSAQEIVLEGDGILPCPPELPISYSKMRRLSPQDGSYDRNFAGRQISGISNSKYDTGDECTDDVFSSQSIQINQKEIAVLRQDSSSIEAKNTLETSSSIPNESSIPNRENEPAGSRLALSDSTEKRKELLSDSHNSSDTPEDSSSSYPLNKQKINPQVDPSANLDGSDNSRTMHAVDNIRSKLVSGNDYEKQDRENEILEGAGTKLSADLRKDYNSNKHSFPQKDNRVHDLAPRHEMDRGRITRKGKEVLHQQYQHYHRQIDSGSTYHAHDIDNHDKNKERGANVESWHKRDGENQTRRIKDGDFQINSGEIGSRHRNKLRVGERKGGGEDLSLRKQSEEVYWRNRHDREGGLKQRDENLIIRRENLDDLHGSRRKDEDPHRRAKVGKEILHGHRAWEDVSQNKKERSDGLDNRRKDNFLRARDKSGDQHFSGHRDEIRWHREREDKLRSKQTHENTRGHRERDEGESVVWDGNLLERKLHDDHRWVKDGAKGFNSDKESMLRRKRNEPLKRGGRNEIQPRHKGFQETHAHESQFSSEIKGYRNGRPINHGNLPFDRQDINREKHRSNTRRSNEPEVKHNSVLPSKRKHEDNGSHQSEKIKRNIQSDENMKIAHGKESVVSKDNYHAVQKQEEKIASDDEGQQESRRGRSKLERWTSNKERDFGSTSNHTMLSSSRCMEVNDNIDMAKSGEVMKAEITTDSKDPSVLPSSNKEESHRHLETVAKLKKRSERFKLPMPVEDPIIGKKSENEVSVIQSESLADIDIKQERPTRKRRWGNN